MISFKRTVTGDEEENIHNFYRHGHGELEREGYCLKCTRLNWLKQTEPFGGRKGDFVVAALFQEHPVESRLSFDRARYEVSDDETVNVCALENRS